MDKNKYQEVGKMENRSQVVKIVFIVIGMVLITLAIVISLIANVGASPYDVFNQGIQMTLGLDPAKIGYVSTAVGTCLVLIAAVVKTVTVKGENKKNFFANISWIAIALGIIMGWMVNTWYQIELVTANVNEGSIFHAAIAMYLMSLGIAMIAKQKMVADPMTTLMMSITDTGLGIVPTRIILDGSMTVFGFILGGTVGVGTLIFLFFLGTCISLNIRYLKFL